MRITGHKEFIVSRVVHVAVGVIVGKDGAILIAKRPDKTHQGGLWEFPGGKVERRETLFDALKRELQEELAIEVVATEPLIKIRHDYGDKVVLLDVHKVTEFSGQPLGNEGQPIRWVAPLTLHEYDFPAANRPIITAINLPQRLLITGEFKEPGDFLVRIESALQKGIRMVQLRLQKSDAIPILVGPVAEICNRYSAKLIINTSPQVFDDITGSSAFGLHLNSAHLLNCNSRPVSDSILLSASCHTESEIKHAEKIGVDYICLSPVLATNSHPDQEGMGWDRFRSLVDDATIPVYALGGMTEADLAIALESGAQGIAAISEWWC
ncbi:MAG TPA: Nudix family hydrolase [Cellvibrio sp.]|nr:Nudix family hydrolase [Cellvibrio sp.]